MGERASGASAMVTAELERLQCVANADTVDGAVVPKITGLVGRGAPAARGLGKKRQVNYADAPQDAARRFGTDLAPLALREFCAG